MFKSFRFSDSGARLDENSQSLPAPFGNHLSALVPLGKKTQASRTGEIGLLDRLAEAVPMICNDGRASETPSARSAERRLIEFVLLERSRDTEKFLASWFIVSISGG